MKAYSKDNNGRYVASFAREPRPDIMLCTKKIKSLKPEKNGSSQILAGMN